MEMMIALILDLCPVPLGDNESHIVKQAHDLVSNIVIKELEKENTGTPTAFQDAVRYQIVANCQTLRITLLVMNQLMSVYNDSIESKEKSEPSLN